MSRDQRAFLAALQLTDSALPIGRFAHSLGLEAFVTRRHAAEDEIIELVESAVIESVGPLDGVATAHAHSCDTVQQLIELDQLVTRRKLSPSSRHSSASSGHCLAVLASVLTTHEPETTYCEVAVAGGTDGNLPVVQGTLARALGLSQEEAVILELKGTAAQLLSAAVRLGRLSARHAQSALRSLEPAILASAEHAVATPATAMRSTTPELEICALMHRRADSRLFST